MVGGTTTPGWSLLVLSKSGREGLFYSLSNVQQCISITEHVTSIDLVKAVVLPSIARSITPMSEGLHDFAWLIRAFP